MNIRFFYIFLFFNLLIASASKANAFETVLSLTSSSTPVLPTAPIACNYTNVTSITFNVSGGSNAPDETNRYILTDISGTIIQSRLVPTFDNLVAGDYAVYAITYETAAGVSKIGAGFNIQDVTSGSSCLRFSNPYSFRLCIDPCTMGTDTDGDGISDICDDDADNDGLTNAEENVNCTGGPVVESFLINETFETGISGLPIPKGSLVGVSGIVGLIEAYNNFPANSSTVNVGEYASTVGFDGSQTMVVDANGGGIVNTFAMSSFILLEGVNLLEGNRYTIEADFSMGLQDVNSSSSPERPSNEYGIAIGAPNQDPIWNDDVLGVPDAVFLYGFGLPLIREPNATLSSISAPPRQDGWYRQYTTYYVSDNGSGVLHLYADNLGHGYDSSGNPTTSFTGTVDYGAASNYPWLDNADISVCADEYIDNIVIK